MTLGTDPKTLMLAVAWVVWPAAVAGCGGTSDPGAGSGAPASASASAEPAPASAAAKPDPFEGNARPELLPVPVERVKRYAAVSFGIDVFDPESDTLHVALSAHPPSAVYRPLTLTVLWRPLDVDGDRGDFEVTITEMRGGAARETKATFQIAVTTEVVPRAGVAGPADPLAGALVDFAGEDLAKVRAAAALDKLLPAALRKELLGRLAAYHRNPLMDPTSKAFEEAWTLGRWELVRVRVRPGSPFPGVSLVYRAAAAEDAFLRLRYAAPTADPRPGASGPGAVAALVRDVLLEGGAPRLLGAAAPARAAAVATLVRRVVGGAAGFVLAAVDHSGRAGGGSGRDAIEAYASGDGWLFISYAPDGHEIPARVVTSIAASGAPLCAPRYRADAPGYVPGVGPLCGEDGLVAVEREKVGSGLLFETSTVAASFRRDHAYAETPLEDARRARFGEAGMTCLDCHTRAFGLEGAAAPIPRTGFVVAAGPRPSAYLAALEAHELCVLRAELEALGAAPGFACPGAP